MVHSTNAKRKTIISIGDNSRISALPDELLSRILSLLPTKDAITTSLLSKRWMFVWTSIDTLNFVDRPFVFHLHKKTDFVNFVNRVLFLLNRPSSIHKFHLTSYVLADVFNINTWICAALEEPNNVIREVDLCIFSKSPMKLPRSLFNCKTLEVLKLTGDLVVFNTLSVCLPKLKVLHLDSVSYVYILRAGSLYFPNLEILHLISINCANDDDRISKLISSCPILEHLVIKRTGEWENVDKTDISAPALTSLDIDYRFEGIIFKLLRGLSFVKCLSLSETTLWAILREPQYLPPMFCNLTRLDFCVNCSDWNALHSLLEKSDNLEHLVCTKGNFPCGGFRSCSTWTEPEHVPKCLLVRLKTVMIRDSRGCIGDLAVVRYVLKNAVVLEKMTIQANMNMNMNLKARSEFVTEITRFPRGSEICVVVA